MSDPAVEAVARALLYEGYLLYPYRASSIKNQKRWTFGSLFPREYAERSAEERGHVVAQVLIRGATACAGVRAVFLSACRRVCEGEPDRVEALERRVGIGAVPLRQLAAARTLGFELPATNWSQDGAHFETCALEGRLEVVAEAIEPGTWKLNARLENVTRTSAMPSREEAELAAFGSAHLLLAVEGGSFVSLLDPPAELAEATRACKSDGVWPALVGDAARCDRMLASPIVVYDFPKVASESRGDYFDATEIDEMLALRVRTLSAAEKREIRAGDARAAAVLERSEALGDTELARLHGARRDEMRPGDHVRLKPRGGRDAFDVLLRGELATIVTIEEDLEGRRYCTVALDADPGRDLGFEGQPGHRFFFEPDELERLT
jgi:hypothetical protein